MEDVKEFIAWLEKYLTEGHEIIGTSTVIYELKKILSSLEEERKEELIRSRIKDACHILIKGE